MRTALCSVLCLSVAVVACAKKEAPPDSTAAAPVATPSGAPAAAAPAISLADVAGTWQLVATPTEGKDTTSTKSTLKTTADTTGWTMTLPGRKPVALHVRVAGDSVMTTPDTYESVRRKGVRVFTTGVFRRQGDKLVGTTTAHYSTKGADSLLHLRSEGTRAP